jgi:hypothetical protein
MREVREYSTFIIFGIFGIQAPRMPRSMQKIVIAFLVRITMSIDNTQMEIKNRINGLVASSNVPIKGDQDGQARTGQCCSEGMRPIL